MYIQEQENDMRNKLSLKTKLFYALGDVFGGGGFQLINFYYTFYLTDTLGLNMIYVGPVILIGKVWDAITDPIMGYISDNTDTKYGRRRPYFIIGSFAVLISFILLWYPLGVDSQLWKFVFSCIAYILFSTAFTITMVPYIAFGADLTESYDERTSLNFARLMFSLFGSLLAATVPLSIVNSLPTKQDGYFIMGIVFAIIFAICVFAVFFAGEEPPYKKTAKQPFNFKVQYIELFKIKTFRNYVLMFILANLGSDIISAMIPYYTKYYLAREGLTSIILAITFLTTIIFVPVWTIVARRKDKKYAYLGGVIIRLITGPIIFLLAGNVSIMMLFPIIVLLNTGIASNVFIPHAMFADIADVMEFIKGEQITGQLSGINTFCRKLSAGIGLFAVTTFLAIMGYVKSEIYIQQSASVLISIKLMLSIVPTLLILVGGYFCYKIPLTRDIHTRIRLYIDARREENSEFIGTEEEYEELKRILS